MTGPPRAVWRGERLLIGGDLVPASGGRTYPNIDPATGEVLGAAPDASVADADAAVAAARRAFDSTGWPADRALRSRGLRQLHQALLDRLEDLRALVVAEAGAPVMLTRSGPQLDLPVGAVAWTADLLDSYEWTTDLGEAEVMGGRHRRWTEREPAGVVAAITPYNFPVQIILAKLAPALAAGCTVVLKAAPETPWSALALGELIAARTDIPPGVVNVLTGSGPEIGQALTAHPGVDMVSFTGSTSTGRQVMAAAAPTIKKVFLELGGKGACLVLDDADLEQAATHAAVTACVHAGQGCAIPTRLLAPAARAEEAAALAAAVMERIPYGRPAEESNLMGPLISEAHRARVESLVEAAVADGAEAVTGGSRPEHLPGGFFYRPTLLSGVGEDDAIAQREVFGPVLAVLAHHGDEDAVRMANNSVYGLSGAVFSADAGRARAVARAVRAGAVSVNGGIYYGPDAPFGGFKQSGVGREMGVAGFEEFLEIKTLAEPAE